MRELVTPHVMHLMSSSFANIFFFCWKCFSTKESKCISPKALKKERFSCQLFLLSLYKNYSTVLTEKKPISSQLLCLPTVISALYHGTKKASEVLQRWRFLAFYWIASCLIIKRSSCVSKRMCASLNQLFKLVLPV